jgi:hypothetical protein
MKSLPQIRIVQDATDLGHRPMAEPGFDLHAVSACDGDTVRNLRLVRHECMVAVYQGQNGEIFHIEDGLL